VVCLNNRISKRHLELREFEEAAESLVKASQLIQQRAAEHERAEAACRQSEELNRFNAELRRSEAEALARATELAVTQRQFRATAERLKAILDHAPVGITINDPKGRLIEPNATYQRICGYSAEELKDKKFTDYTHPDDVAKNLQLYEQLASDELQSYEIEKRYIRKDGKIIWVRVIASRIDEQTNIGIIEDITERKQAQEALGESERFLRTVIDLVPHLIFVKDQDSRYLLVNRACAETYGTTPLQMVGRYTSELVSNPDYAEVFIKADREVILDFAGLCSIRRFGINGWLQTGVFDRIRLHCFVCSIQMIYPGTRWPYTSTVT
jgi:PAS domain S-box-containing protein